jgi:FixJ family two-component response regulator
MYDEYLLIVDDNRPLANAVAMEFEKRWGDKYSIEKFYDADPALEFIDEIDKEGGVLAAVVTDERLQGRLQGHQLIEILQKTHPETQRAILSAYSDIDAIKDAIRSGIKGFVHKERNGTAGDPLYKLVDEMLQEHENESASKIQCSIDGITFKLATTLYEKKEFFRERKEVYCGAGHYCDEDLRKECVEANMEWDDYDEGGIEFIKTRNPKIRYVVAMKEGKCVGGARIIDGKLPMETGICVEDGFGFKKGERFHLDKLRENEVFTREISRLVVDKQYRNSYVLIGLFRIMNQICLDQNTMFCTSLEKRKGLYQLIGFMECGPYIEYSLNGYWKPMLRDHWKATNRPETISGIDKTMHEMALEPFPVSDIDSWTKKSRALNEVATKMGFYDDYKTC